MSAQDHPHFDTRDHARQARLCTLRSVALSGLLLWGLGACGTGTEEREAGAADPDLIQARDRAAEFGLWEKDGWAEAQRTLEPFANRADAAAEDLLRMACALLGNGAVEEARPYVDRAAELVSDDPVLAWCRFRMARIDYDNERALKELRTVLELAPEDVPTQLACAMVLSDLAMEAPGGSDADNPRAAEALELLESFLDLPPETTGSWRVTALFRYSSLLRTLGQAERAQQFFDEYERYGEQGIESPGEPEHQPSTLGAIAAHSPNAFELAPVPSAPAPPAFARLSEDVALAGVASLYVAADPKLAPMAGGPAGEELWRSAREPAALVLFGAAGMQLLERSPEGWSAPRSLLSQAVVDAIPFDRGNRSTEPSSFQWKRPGDPYEDLLVTLPSGSGFELRLLENTAGEWTLSEPFFSSAKAPGRRPVVAVDLDHEGDLDLVVATEDSLHVLRNDGFDTTYDGWSDVSAELPLPSGSFVPSAEDVDRDNDVDLLFHNEATGELRYLSSERGWKFVDASSSLPETSGRWTLVSDLDGTGFVDFASFGERLIVQRRDAMGLDAGALEWPLPAAPGGPPIVVDWDLDGTSDLLWPSVSGGVAGILAPGFPEGGVPFHFDNSADSAGAGDAGTASETSNALWVRDLDGDFDQDLLLLDAKGLLAGTSDARAGFLLELRGYKDNARGVGAELQLRQGRRYRRVFWDGSTRLVSMGAATVDMLRITWPNGVIQSYFDLARETSYTVWQRPGLVGSCPFLYTWNGETYTFISDVLGITPLGLPMQPGMLVPPDHDEYVLVPGEALRPKDGFYELQFTEELREVTYLDRVRLDVIDHPADVEIFPNERFTFPPFPEAHVHTVRAPLTPLSAVDGEGRDWTDALAANDRELAIPFEPLEGQFQGLATPHQLELAFDARALRDAKRLRLVMNGWFYWTDASVNVAAARHPQVEFIPPLLQVPDGEGGWRTVEEPLGFPAGKLKTMVVDVTDAVDREDPRLRIFSTLRLYWDSIRLAHDDDRAPFVSTSLEPTSAALWERGFSEPVALEGPHHLEWFEWERLAAEPRWNQHPGLYTRLGQVLPLVTEIDDRFVIMGAGDALTLRFDASAAPALPSGWRRDFLVFLDGWAKDRDPNTIEALRVEPLPFHGMSGYPYASDESFPNDAEHERWRREWNTRPARRWIPAVLPPQAPQTLNRP